MRASGNCFADWLGRCSSNLQSVDDTFGSRLVDKSLAKSTGIELDWWCSKLDGELRAMVLRTDEEAVGSDTDL